MAISLFTHHLTQRLTIITGHESGHTSISHLDPTTQKWHVLYTAQTHAQPVLSLDIMPDLKSYFTSAADAIIAQHPIPVVMSGRPVKEGEFTALKIYKTKHAGQQGLRVRNDGKILATAGWDARVRVYNTKTGSELAVLKWHKEGCYTVAFADVEVDGTRNDLVSCHGEKDMENGNVANPDRSLAVRNKASNLTVKERRVKTAHHVHWIAVGSKDGKVSLWDIY